MSVSFTIITNDIDEEVLQIDLSGQGLQYESNVLVLGDVQVETGGSVRLPFYLNNTDIVTGFQFDLKLYDGMSIVPDSLFLSPKRLLSPAASTIFLILLVFVSFSLFQLIPHDFW